MSLNLPDNISLPTNPGRHNTAIAELVFWSAVFLIAFPTRIIQEWYYWDHRCKRSYFLCLFFGWRGMIGVVAQLRIVGFSMYLAAPHGSKGLIITEVVLQGIGVTPLLFELTLLLRRCNRINLLNEKNANHFSAMVSKAIRWSTIPVLVAAIIIGVAGGLVNTTLVKVGAAIILAAFVYFVLLFAYIVLRSEITALPENGRRAVWLMIAALPFYVVRLVYLMLADFGSVKYSPAIGDWKLTVGLEFLMEILIVILLQTAELIVQPLFGHSRKRQSGQTHLMEELPKVGQNA